MQTLRRLSPLATFTIACGFLVAAVTGYTLNSLLGSKANKSTVDQNKARIAQLQRQNDMLANQLKLVCLAQPTERRAACLRTVRQIEKQNSQPSPAPKQKTSSRSSVAQAPEPVPGPTSAPSNPKPEPRPRPGPTPTPTQTAPGPLAPVRTLTCRVVGICR